jgi:2-oxoglutarate ferredoxin oxidoreductase subunit alpha
MIGQMMEEACFDLLPPPSPPPKPWALTGEPGRKRNLIRSFRLSPDDLEELNLRLQAKYAEILAKESRFELAGPADADVLLTAYGTSARICRQIVERPPRPLPFKVALFRPITLWPFPKGPLAELAQKARGIVAVELSAGQMVEDVRLAVEGRCHVEFYGRMGGQVPAAADVTDRLISLFA